MYENVYEEIPYLHKSISYIYAGINCPVNNAFSYINIIINCTNLLDSLLFLHSHHKGTNNDNFRKD